MKVIGFLKKRVNWSLDRDEDGSIRTGDQSWNYSSLKPVAEKKETGLAVPIFTARLKYDYYDSNRSSVTVNFTVAPADDEEALIAVLKGLPRKCMRMSQASYFKTMELISDGTWSFEDGYIHGTFVYKKNGPTVSIEPFLRNINDEEPV